MCAIVVVIVQPFIKIPLQFFNGAIDFAAECNLIKLLQNRFMETLANAIGLWMPHFCFGVLNVVQCQIELVIVRFRFPAIFSAAISKYADKTC